MRFAYLASGSRGNSALVDSGNTLIMLDCGLRLSDAEQRLQRLGVAATDIDAIVVTHEHGDHINGVGLLAHKYNLPVWLTPGTNAGWKKRRDHLQLNFVNAHEPFAIGDLQVQPYPVPHDAREPCQYVFSDGCKRLGVLSDVGRLTPHIVATLKGCDALLLEFNHDRDMLLNGPYPNRLKKRVAGPYGHLSNMQAAELLAELRHDGLQHLVIAHISQVNNSTELALAAACQALGQRPLWLVVADQEAGLQWTTIQ